MASGARKAYVEGASFSGKTGWRATAAGLKDVARAGASAAGRGVKSRVMGAGRASPAGGSTVAPSAPPAWAKRSEEHTSELQSLMRISYAVFCLKKKKTET